MEQTSRPHRIALGCSGRDLSVGSGAARPPRCAASAEMETVGTQEVVHALERRGQEVCSVISGRVASTSASIGGLWPLRSTYTDDLENSSKAMFTLAHAFACSYPAPERPSRHTHAYKPSSLQPLLSPAQPRGLIGRYGGEDREEQRQMWNIRSHCESGQENPC